MQRKKPATLLVLGILNLLFGSIDFLRWLCCCLAFGFGYSIFLSAYQQVSKEDQQALEPILEPIWRAFDDKVPGLVPVLATAVTVFTVLATVQILSGIGLIRAAKWGRWLAVLWGVLAIPALVAFVLWQVLYFFPGVYDALPELEKAMQQIEEKQRQQGIVPPPRQNFNNIGGTGNPIVDNIVWLGIQALQIGYAGIVVVFMILPQTGRAIARYRSQDTGQQQAELYDDPYERRRRKPDEPPIEGGQS